MTDTTQLTLTQQLVRSFFLSTVVVLQFLKDDEFEILTDDNNKGLFE